MATRRVCSPVLTGALRRLVSPATGPSAGTTAVTPPPLSSLSLSPASLVLGIETSCDDTGVAVVRGDGVVMGQALVTQV